MNDFLTLQETADMLKKSTQTVRRMIKKGDLQAKKVRTAQGFQYAIERKEVTKGLDEVADQSTSQPSSHVSSQRLDIPMMPFSPSLPVANVGGEMDSLMDTDFYLLEPRRVDAASLEKHVQRLQKEKMVLIHILESLQAELAQERQRPRSILRRFFENRDV